MAKLTVNFYLPVSFLGLLSYTFLNVHGMVIPNATRGTSAHKFIWPPGSPNNNPHQASKSLSPFTSAPSLWTSSSSSIGSLSSGMSLWATRIMATDCYYVLVLTSTQTLTTKGNFLCAQPLGARRLALHLHPRCRRLAIASNPQHSGWYI